MYLVQGIIRDYIIKNIIMLIGHFSPFALITVNFYDFYVRIIITFIFRVSEDMIYIVISSAEYLARMTDATVCLLDHSNVLGKILT